MMHLLHRFYGVDDPVCKPPSHAYSVVVYENLYSTYNLQHIIMYINIVTY